MPLVHWQVPAEINDEVRTFCRSIVPNREPRFVRVDPPGFTSPNLCFQNAELTMKVKGGRRQFGWYLHEETEHLLIQAVFHAVWVSPEGELIDVTPHPLHGERIVFLPDPLRIHRGKLIPNRFYPLVDDPIIESLITEIELEVKYWEKYHDPKHPMRVNAPSAVIKELLEFQELLRQPLEELRQKQRHRS